MALNRELETGPAESGDGVIAIIAVGRTMPEFFINTSPFPPDFVREGWGGLLDTMFLVDSRDAATREDILCPPEGGGLGGVDAGEGEAFCRELWLGLEVSFWFEAEGLEGGAMGFSDTPILRLPFLALCSLGWCTRHARGGYSPKLSRPFPVEKNSGWTPRLCLLSVSGKHPQIIHTHRRLWARGLVVNRHLTPVSKSFCYNRESE
eukprot:1180314-Prorocentrum_minimum.AAC.1